MSFLPLSLPVEKASKPDRRHGGRAPVRPSKPRREEGYENISQYGRRGQDRKFRRRLRVDPHRCETAGKCAAAFFRCNPYGAPLFAYLIADFRQGHVWLRRFTFGAQALKKTADEPAKPEILRREILHLHHRRKVETAEAPPPAVESSRRHRCDPTDFGDRHASACLMEQMKDFAFGELGPSHRDRLVQLLARDRSQSQAAIPFAAE
jgi:hypothetical protein